MPKLSIIVCTYNRETTLEKCINSILNQTFSDFELIIIDDGSTDNSYKIYEKYKLLDKRINVIFKEHSGIGDTRNVGIDHASGNYIGFVDSDDYIDNNMYEILYRNAKKYNADISCCRILVEFADKKIIAPNPDGEYCKVFEKSDEMIEAFFKGEYYVTGLVNKIYRRMIFDNLRFPEKCTFEDDLFLFPTLERSKRVVCDSRAKYHYVQTEYSIMKRPFSKNDLELVECGEYNLSIVKNRYPNLVGFAEGRLLNFRRRIIDKILNLNSQENIIFAKQQRQEIVKRLNKIILNNEIRIGEKIALICIALNLKFYKILLKMKRLLL